MGNRGQIYELVGEDVQEIIDEIFEDNTELETWYQTDGQVRERIESIFYTDNTEKVEDIYLHHGQGYYWAGKKACLYHRDSRTHICVRAMVLDFIKIIFSPTVWNVVKNSYCQCKGIKSDDINVGDVIVLIEKIKNAVTQNIVKLRGEDFCFYLQMITHFAEHRDVSIDELLDWIPKTETECSWSEVKLVCGFKENNSCLLKSKEDYKILVQRKLDAMVGEKVLIKNLCQKDQYKINY